jgi:surfeit locus 1 family protein
MTSAASTAVPPPAPGARRRPWWVAPLASLIGLAITVSACVWQLGRGREKDRLAAELAARYTAAAVVIPRTAVRDDGELVFRHVQARGTFVPQHTLLLDNQARGPQPGYVVFTPLRLGDGPLHVLVKRGWTPASPDRAQLPTIATPDGEVIVDGLALAPQSRFLELSAETADTGPVRQNITVERVARATGLAFQPLILEQRDGWQASAVTPPAPRPPTLALPVDATSAAEVEAASSPPVGRVAFEDDLSRDWPAPVSASAKHYGYAFQWGAMAAAIVVLNLLFAVRRRRARHIAAAAAP